ncbi:homoserine kinase [Lutispora thermophila]|uniref:Homoserine kinase n=1 Tax=Lutispora thermophila DSM 19022 TaxID=1122184 RepID=A0A1M6ASD9_9FIRM|nr:homoserine kinase [Lutispora thermophila]SHI39386.1 homoserine kinase [Lutispora thermophila DSM 19022]
MIEVAVKATTANLGPGFDCLGLALDIENRVKFSESHRNFPDKNNMIYSAVKRIFDITGKPMPLIDIHQQIGIPVCRGLGSSAACIAVGCIAGNIMSGANMSIDELIKIGTEMEGHPDNIVPAFLGGFTVSFMAEEKVVYFRQKAYEGFKYAVMYPEYTLPTAQAREVLPKEIAFKDGVFNIGRASLLTAAMITGDVELLKYACRDKLHQPYRKSLVPEFDNIVDKAQSLGALASFLSGAGPTIIAILSKDEKDFEVTMKNHLKIMKGNWTLKIVEASNEGVRVL